MLDIETMGTQKNAAMLSIACVAFDRKTGVAEKDTYFYRRIDPNDYDNYPGRFSMDISTIMWWMEQEREVQQEAWGGKLPLKGALGAFLAWLPGGSDLHVWAHGKDFDPPIVENALKACKMPIPWKFWQTLDTRTAYFLADTPVRPLFPIEGFPKHHPVGDCLSQIDALRRAIVEKK